MWGVGMRRNMSPGRPCSPHSRKIGQLIILYYSVSVSWFLLLFSLSLIYVPPTHLISSHPSSTIFYYLHHHFHHLSFLHIFLCILLLIPPRTYTSPRCLRPRRQVPDALLLPTGGERFGILACWFLGSGTFDIPFPWNVSVDSWNG